MRNAAATSDVNIHLRAREQDRDLIDQAAALTGQNRSHFMLASSLKEAKNVLLDQTTIIADNQAFQQILAWMDADPTKEELAGMKRLMNRKADWVRD
jgi:uncharacterized protein (DUF1778 family)